MVGFKHQKQAEKSAAVPDKGRTVTTSQQLQDEAFVHGTTPGCVSILMPTKASADYTRFTDTQVLVTVVPKTKNLPSSSFQTQGQYLWTTTMAGRNPNILYQALVLVSFNF